MKTSVLNLGFYNYVTTDSVVALIDYKLEAAKKIVRSVKSEKPRSLLDVTKGRKCQTLVVLTGDRYVISAIYRQQLATRLMQALNDEIPSDKQLTTLAQNDNETLPTEPEG